MCERRLRAKRFRNPDFSAELPGYNQLSARTAMVGQRAGFSPAIQKSALQ
jgi:hypothetical protein